MRGAAGGNSAAGDEEIGWAIGHALPAVRDILRRMPAGATGPGRPAIGTISCSGFVIGGIRVVWRREADGRWRVALEHIG